MSFATSLKGFKEILSFDNRVELIFHHLFRNANALCTYRFSKFQVVVLKSGGDLNGLRACIATDQYKQFFTQMDLGKPLKILDLGAHTGGFIFAILSDGHRIYKSLSVEQNRQTHSRLAFNLALNQLQDTCQSLHAAAWSTATNLVSSHGAGRTSAKVDIPSSADGIDESRAVQSYTVNELLAMVEENTVIDICKIDVEGAEWEIFSQLESCQLLAEQCRYIIIEIHPSSEHTLDLPNAIQDNGFELIAKCKFGDETFLYRNRNLAR